MKQFLFVVVTACILCGMCVVVLASNPVVSKQGVELAVNLTRAMIAMVIVVTKIQFNFQFKVDR